MNERFNVSIHRVSIHTLIESITMAVDVWYPHNPQRIIVLVRGGGEENLGKHNLYLKTFDCYRTKASRKLLEISSIIHAWVSCHITHVFPKRVGRAQERKIYVLGAFFRLKDGRLLTYCVQYTLTNFLSHFYDITIFTLEMEKYNFKAQTTRT